MHAQLSWPGLLTRVCLTPANEADGEIAPLLQEGTTGVLGDRNYWLPDLQAFLWTKGIVFQAPFRKAHSRHPLPRTRVLCWDGFATSSTRYDGQLTDRCQMKRVWARDLWHLRNRLLRYILMHTVCFFLNQQEGTPYLQFDQLVA